MYIVRVSSRAAQSNSSNVTSSQNKQSNSVVSNATGSSAVKSRNVAKSVAAAQKLSLPKKSEVSRWSLVYMYLNMTVHANAMHTST